MYKKLIIMLVIFMTAVTAVGCSKVEEVKEDINIKVSRRASNAFIEKVTLLKDGNFAEAQKDINLNIPAGGDEEFLRFMQKMYQNFEIVESEEVDENTIKVEVVYPSIEHLLEPYKDNEDMINKMIEELDSGEYHKYRKELVVKYANGKIVNDLELFKALTFLE